MAKSRLSLQIIDPEKARVIRLQADLVRDEGFFLAGGVGLAVRLGHRLSADLDWFTPRRFDAGAIERHLEALAECPTQILRHGRHTVRAYYGTLETSFITYGQVPASPEIMKVAGTEIPVADIAIETWGNGIRHPGCLRRQREPVTATTARNRTSWSGPGQKLMWWSRGLPSMADAGQTFPLAAPAAVPSASRWPAPVRPGH